MKNKISNKKIIAWKKTLTKDQKSILNKIVEDEGRKIFQSEVSYLDSAISSVLIKIFNDLSLDDIKQIQEQICTEMFEEKECVEKLTREFLSEEGYVEYMKDLEKDIKEFIEESLKNGLNQKRIREEAIIKFYKLSNSQITNAIKKIKKDFDVKNAVDQSQNNEKKEEVCIKMNDEIKNKKNENIKRKLTIKKIDIEGEFANYEYVNGCIKLNIDNLKIDKELWEEFKTEVEEVFRMVK